MRPFPRGHRGLTLTANGMLNPAGEAYLNMAIKEGLSAKPGERVVLSDIRFDHAKIVFDLNGGPDKKHRFLSHVQIGLGPGVVNPGGRTTARSQQARASPWHLTVMFPS